MNLCETLCLRRIVVVVQGTKRLRSHLKDYPDSVGDD